MSNTWWRNLLKKAYHPSKLTDKELAQVRRSVRTGSNLLRKIVVEQSKRGLLRHEYKVGMGYPPEIKRNI